MIALNKIKEEAEKINGEFEIKQKVIVYIN